MARFRRLDVYRLMLEDGLVPVFYHADPAVAKKIVRACAAGGARAIEFTNRGDLAYQVFAELLAWVRKELPGVALGVGSIIDAPTAALYIASGADFVVGPISNPEIAALANRRKIAYVPGCGSATEISQAEERGAEIVKVFPGEQVGGPAFVKAILGPCPWTSIMPTGGVEPTEASIRAWFGAGVVCVGMGSNLMRKEWIEAGDFAAVERSVASTLALIKTVRS
jgi:2-dehydro-3-deoxyphosphogluconate aldolase / (4S)-4-hydroxy-2-oxoglutarate aldolase